MFVRLKRVGACRYLQLVESFRVDDKPGQRVLATLGRQVYARREHGGQRLHAPYQRLAIEFDLFA